MPIGDEVAILDEAGCHLQPGSIGEISIRGANVMQGYASPAEANATAFSDGWLRTGDRGYQDSQGYVFIQGRLKELINRGGEKIIPHEIDEVLLQHPAVLQAVAFAVPHSGLGEDVAAAVVLRLGAEVTAMELRGFAARHLADFKVPRKIVFLRDIPKGPTGKVQRIGLAGKLRAELEAGASPEAGSHMPPRTRLEEQLAGIWCEVLGVSSIGVLDDFFMLGGDLLRGAQLLAKIGEQIGVELTLGDLFNASTIASLAEQIGPQTNTPGKMP